MIITFAETLKLSAEALRIQASTHVKYEVPQVMPVQVLALITVIQTDEGRISWEILTSILITNTRE